MLHFIAFDCWKSLTVESFVRASGWDWAASTVSCASVSAADLEIVSTMSFESNGKQYVEPRVRNNTTATRPTAIRQAYFKVGNQAARWTLHPLAVPPDQTVCCALDAPPIAPRLANEIPVE